MRNIKISEITTIGVNIAEKSTVIRNVTDMLHGFWPQLHEYGFVIFFA